MQYHPDRNPDNPDAEEQFKECGEAYAILSDAEKRARYDRFGHAGVSGNGGGGGGFDPSGFVDVQDIFGDIFGDMFGGGGRGGRRSRAQRGADMREDITLEFEEAVFGVTKQAKVRRLEECDQCHGTGAAPGLLRGGADVQHVPGQWQADCRSVHAVPGPGKSAT